MDPKKSLNESFMYNSMLSRAMIQLIPQQERQIVRMWLTKLHEMGEGLEIMRRRNEYMWFMLLMLQNKRMQAPFNRQPPLGDLRELKDILNPEIYEDVLTSTDMSWLDTIPMGTKEEAVGPTKIPRAHPVDFKDNQPEPKNGVICYFAAFSDHDC